MEGTRRGGHSSSMWENAWQGARDGAAQGALVGGAIVTTVMATGVFHNVLERGNRAIGNTPNWPLVEGDCESSQFCHYPMCTNPPLFDSFSSFAFYVVGATTIAGTIIGAVNGAANNVFVKAHSE